MASPARSLEPELTPVQAQVVQALAQGMSVTAASDAAGVNRGTIYNWFNSQPHFAAAVQEARAEYVAALRDDLQDLSRVALKAVRQLLEDPKTSPGIRAKLALAVLQRPKNGAPRSWNLPVGSSEAAHPPVQQFSTKFSPVRRAQANEQSSAPEAESAAARGESGAREQSPGPESAAPEPAHPAAGPGPRTRPAAPSPAPSRP